MAGPIERERPWSPAVNDAWIADRMSKIEASGIRKAFDMSKAMKDPINLSIGLPDFDVAEPVKAAAIEAIERGHNAYTLTQGLPELRTRLQAAVDAEFGHADRQVHGHLGLLGRAAAGALLGGQSRRRGDPLRPVFRDVQQPRGPGRGCSGPGRHLPRLPHRRRQGRRRDHAPDQVRPGQLAEQPDGGRRSAPRR